MSQEKLLLFAGTTEGRRLFTALEDRGIPVDVSVATEYGGSLLDASLHPESRILVNRLTTEEMQALIHQNGYRLVVDATHPYATEVTANIRCACEREDVPYMRLLRPKSVVDDVLACGTLDEAIEYLSIHEGNVLSTIGSKELAALTRLKGYENRVFARILPLPSAVDACVKLGFGGQNLICMQGPFSYEMNVAMLKQYHCRYLLTKDSGKAGGMEEKMQAAADTGVQVLLVCRPIEQNGLSYREVLQYIEERWNVSGSIRQKKTHFPLFIPSFGKQVLVVGGGSIATRRVHTLCRFDWRIKVIAPEASMAIQELADNGDIVWIKRPFIPADLDNAFLVTAATNRREVNEQVALLAKERGIFASIADDPDACSFYFPAVIAHDTVTIGLVGDGRNHKAVSQTAQCIREVLGDEN